jgi:hypothetical protein
MTPNELLEYLKALGVPGGMAAAMLYLWTTRQQASPGKSRLEEDVQRMSERQEQMMRELHALASDVARIEGRLDGK